jgi:hypothetical protein
MSSDNTMNNDRPQFIEIRPIGDKYVDQFWSGMYGNLCASAQVEQSLVWLRYTAFLLVHGLFFTIGKDYLLDSSGRSPGVLFLAGLLGLAVCVVWSFLNYCGWRNQTKLFRYASRFKFMDANLELPTDIFHGRREPFGPIYRAAQALPLSFGVLDCFCTVPCIAETVRCGAIAHWAGAIAIGAVFLFVFWLACRWVRINDAV